MPEILGRDRPPRLATPPSSPALGELYYDTATSTLYWWNGSAWIPARGATTATALPGTPFDGQEIYLQTAQMATDNVCWHLRYRASLASNKWEFLGGAIMQSIIATQESTSSTTIGDNLATVGPSQTIDYAGVYDVTYEAMMITAAIAGNAAIAGFAGPGVAAGAAIQVQTPAAAATIASASKTLRATFTGAGAVKMQYRSSSASPGTVSFANRGLRVAPVRIGG